MATMTPLQAAAFAAGVMGGLARRLERQNPRYVNKQWLEELARQLRDAEACVLEACEAAGARIKA